MNWPTSADRCWSRTSHLLPHVSEVLAAVSPSVRTVLITKGDLVHQTRKVTTSGIEHHFTDVEIVLEKDPDTYSRILQRLERDARAGS